MSYATKEIFLTARLYEIALPELKEAFRQLEIAVPPPRLMKVNGHFAYRFVEKTSKQAIVLKLARVVTGLQATWSVLHAGFTQEPAALQRILDELGSDIMFLAGPLTIGEHEKAHDQFLEEFFQEEFDEGKTPIDSSQKRHRVPRQKIRAYNARTFNSDGPVSLASTVLSTIDSVYSGYVHAAAVHTMDTYGGTPPKFHIDGMYLTTHLDDSFIDFRNHIFRSLINAAIAARALSMDDLFRKLHGFSDQLAREFELWPN